MGEFDGNPCEWIVSRDKNAIIALFDYSTPGLTYRIRPYQARV